jgi:hypothetical protein
MQDRSIISQAGCKRSDGAILPGADRAGTRSVVHFTGSQAFRMVDAGGLEGQPQLWLHHR